MQWDSTVNGGFSSATPWMRANDDYPEWNVARQKDDPSSVLSFWKKMLRFRKEHLACVSD
jgi:alpha-glucosidase